MDKKYKVNDKQFEARDFASMESIKQIEELSFEGDIATNFKKWKQRFIIYMNASGTKDSTTISGERKVAVLLHTIGSEALEVFDTLELTETEKNDWEVVLQKLEEHFVPQSNETVNRHIFNTRNQREGETIDSFVTDLKVLSKNCNFGTLRDSLIRDRIVCGVSDKTLRDRLLRESKLDLSSCVRMCRAAEICEAQAKQLMDENKVHAVKKQWKKEDNVKGPVKEYGRDDRKKYETNSSNRYNKDSYKQQYNHPSSHNKPCRHCGTVHAYKNCPAYGKLCNNCKKYNHFAKACRSKGIHAIQEDTNSSETFFVETINAQQKVTVNSIKEWTVMMQINGKSVQFKMDTGSEVNIINKYVEKNVGAHVEARKVKLGNYNGSPINVMGFTKFSCDMQDLNYELDFQIVDREAPCILGLPSIQKFKLLQKVYSIGESYNEEELVKKY